MNELYEKFAAVMRDVKDPAMAASLIADAVRAADARAEDETALSRERAKEEAKRDRDRDRKRLSRTLVSAQSAQSAGTQKGGDLISDLDLGSGEDPDQTIPCVQNVARTARTAYSDAFETAWKAYPRREEKANAYRVWRRTTRAGTYRDESALLADVLAALRWQTRELWAGDNVRYAPYFERYLKNSKWLDEPTKATPTPSPYKKLT